MDPGDLKPRSEKLLHSLVFLFSKHVEEEDALEGFKAEIVKDYFRYGRCATLDMPDKGDRAKAAREGMTYSLKVRDWWYHLLLGRTLLTSRAG